MEGEALAVSVSPETGAPGPPSTAPEAAPLLSVVVACYQEESHLADSVRQLRATLDQSGLSYELIFLDDCSTDRTPQIVAELVRGRANERAVFHRQNVGRGGTVSEGFQLARGQIVGFLDIDLEVHCRYIPDMVAAILQGFDGATAYREYSVGMSLNGFVRHVLSQGYRWLFRRCLRLPFRDTETGYKFFVRERILPVLAETRDQGWFWDTEIMALAHRAGLRIQELPCRFVRRGDKKSTVRICRDTWRYLVAMARFRRRLRAEARTARAFATASRSVP
jgi:glycosyltransferase involved in cell wall biosynthesis